MVDKMFELKSCQFSNVLKHAKHLPVPEHLTSFVASFRDNLNEALVCVGKGHGFKTR